MVLQKVNNKVVLVLEPNEVDYIKRRLKGDVSLQELADDFGATIGVLKEALTKYGVN